MFCPNCGTHLPDGSAFCATCGNPLAQAPAAATAPTYAEPAAPVYADPNPPVYADPVPPAYGNPNPPVYADPVPPVYGNPYGSPAVAKTKKVWLSTLASPKAKKMNKLSTIFTAACALVLILAIFTAYFGPFYNIPVFKMVMGNEMISEFKDLQREALEADEEMNDMLYDLGISLGSLADDDKIEEIYDACMALVKNPSFGNMRKLMVVCEEREAVAGYDLILSFLWIAFGLVILLAVLGGLLKKTGLVIAAIVVSIPVNLLFGGVLFLILTIAALGILAYTLMQISGEYKAYKQNPGNVYIA
jgi:hypothetical protein